MNSKSYAKTTSLIILILMLFHNNGQAQMRVSLDIYELYSNADEGALAGGSIEHTWKADVYVRNNGSVVYSTSFCEAEDSSLTDYWFSHVRSVVPNENFCFDAGNLQFEFDLEAYEDENFPFCAKRCKKDCGDDYHCVTNDIVVNMSDYLDIFNTNTPTDIFFDVTCDNTWSYRFRANVDINSPDSVNLGRTNTQIPFGDSTLTAQTNYCAGQDTIILWCKPYDPSRWPAGTNYVYEMSMDAGTTWNNLASSANNQVDFVPPTPNVPYDSINFRVHYQAPCMKSFKYNFPQIYVYPAPPSDADYLEEDVLCQGDYSTVSGGRIEVTSITGGMGAFNYYIKEINFQAPLLSGDPNPENGIFEGLPPGDHMVILENSDGICRYIVDTIRIDEPDSLYIDGVNTTNVQCLGGNDGTLTISGTGGVPPYEYLLYSPADSTWNIFPDPLFTDLSAGNYVTILQDANGCLTPQKIVQINEPPTAVSAILSATSLSCNNSDDGSINIAATGGNPPYQYSKDGGLSFVSGTVPHNFNNLPAGIYHCAVKDANSCIFNDTIEITEPGMLILTQLGSDSVSCNAGNDGTIHFKAEGGSPNYQFSIDNINFQADSSFYNLSAGIQTLYVQDGNACAGSQSFTIHEPDPLILTASVITNTSCFGLSDGGFELEGTGGLPPYEFSIDGGTTFQSNTGYSPLGVNTYNCIIRDSKFCTAALPVTVGQPDILDASVFTTTAVTCHAATDGTISSNPAGGTAPYQYSLNPNNGYQTSNSFSGLAAGTYNIHIQDANNCMAVSNANISSPPMFAISMDNVTDATCNAAANGSAVILASGGVTPHTFSVDGGTTFQNSGTFNGLDIGDYNVLVKDANNCTRTAAFQIGEPPVLTINATTPNMINCYDNNGEINITAQGGNPFYQYSIDNGANYQNSPSFSNLGAGTYNAIVIDQNACTSSQAITLVQMPNSLTLDVVSADSVSCNGGSDGIVSLMASGGSGDYRYKLSTTTSFVNSPIFGGLPVGVHTFLVEDNISGCITSTTATVGEPVALDLSVASIEDETCYLAANGEVTLSATGGTPPYTYGWNNSISQSSPLFTGLQSGANLFSVQDAKGCTQTQIVNINSASAMFLTYNANNVSCNGAGDGSISTNITGGTAPFNYYWNGVLGGMAHIDLAAGTYELSIEDSNGCSALQNITITEPFAMNALVTNLNAVACNGSNNGSFDVIVNGGFAPYSYSLDGGITTQSDNSFQGLASGIYDVLVTDSNGCAATANANITMPGSMVVNVANINHVSCNGGNDGLMEIDVTGGTMPYTYSMDGVSYAGANYFTDLPSGNYTISVLDGSGCFASANAGITEPTVMSSSTSVIRDASCGMPNGQASVSITGGTPPYTYLWDNIPIQNSNILNNAFAGEHIVAVTDANGCIHQSLLALMDSDGPAGSVAAFDNSACNQSIGSITVGATGGIPPYDYEWSHDDGLTGETAFGLSSGTYNITVSDGDGCEDIITANIMDINGPVVSLQNVSPSACDMAIGSIAVSVAGGTAPYAYLWDDANVQTTSVASGLPEGNYNVRVTDVDGCVGILAVEIEDVPDLEIANTSLVQPSCVGATDGELAVAVQGGTAPYGYLWNDSNGQTGSMATGLAAGIYILNVTDANGCMISYTDSLAESPIVVTTSGIVVASCTGGDDASAEIMVEGGTGPYVYSWPGGGADALENNLAAGIYDVTVTDGNNCGVVHEVVVGEPILYETVLSEAGDTLLCLGQSLDIDFMNSNHSYSWGGTESFYNNGEIANITKAGTYWVAATNEFGCIARDTIIVNYSNDVLQANFLLQSEALVGDTVTAVEISWPVPDSVQWIYDTDSITHVDSYLNSEILLFPYQGIYTIGVEGYLGDCVDYIEKEIIVFMDEDSLVIPGTGGLGSEILEFVVFPNPNDGTFTVRVVLAFDMDVQMRIYHENGTAVDSRLSSGASVYEEGFNLPNLSTGVHTILLQTENDWRSISFVVVD